MHFLNKESGNIKLVDLRISKRNKSQTTKNVCTGNIVMDIVFTWPKLLKGFHIHVLFHQNYCTVIPSVQCNSPTFVGKALLLDYLSLECFHSEPIRSLDWLRGFLKKRNKMILSTAYISAIYSKEFQLYGLKERLNFTARPLCPF